MAAPLGPARVLGAPRALPVTGRESLGMSVPRDRAETSLPDALALIGAVRDGGPDAVAAVMARADLPAVVVVLAAMVPDDRTPGELLAWADPTAVERERKRDEAKLERLRRRHAAGQRTLQPCGTHAAYTRHKNRCEEACEACVLAERIYQRDRMRRRRGQADESAA